MTTIHPHWDATDGGEQQQPRRTVQKRSEATRVSIAVPQGSRRPAAILGILGVIAIGFGVVQSLGNFSAQVAPVPVIVRITAAGASPKNFSIQQGQPITWKNTDTVTRTISSDLLTASGAMTKLAIKSGSSATIVVAEDADVGSYSYTDDDNGAAVLGKITITKKIAATGSGETMSSTSTDSSIASAASVASATSSATSVVSAASVSSTSSASQQQSSASSKLQASGSVIGVANSSSSRSVILSTGDDTFAIPHNAAGSSSSEDEIIAGIAKNPHVVGTETSRPSSSSPSVTQNAAPLANEQLHGGAPLLAQQQYVHTTTTVPQTGPEAWAITLVSVALLFWFCRKSLQA